MIIKHGIWSQTYYTRSKPIVPYRWEFKVGRFSFNKYYRGDDIPDAHDHPADFYVFPLHGYVEAIYDPMKDQWYRRVVLPWKIQYFQATLCHRLIGRWTNRKTIVGIPVVAVNDKPFYTIVWTKSKTREWGFYKSSIWVSWKDYLFQSHKTWVD